MGLRSRRKGQRVEYLVRDTLRKEGFDADRVPASGAAQGFKGDIRAIKDGKTYLIEVKSRQDSFTKAYEFACALHMGAKGTKLCGGYSPQAGQVEIGYSMSDLIAPSGAIVLISPTHEQYKLFLSVLKLESLLGLSDILVLKDDRKPLLFLRFKSGTSN